MTNPDDATHSRREHLLQTVHFRPPKRCMFCAHDTVCVQDTDKTAWAVTEPMSAVENLKKKGKKMVELFFFLLPQLLCNNFQVSACHVGCYRWCIYALWLYLDV